METLNTIIDKLTSKMSASEKYIFIKHEIDGESFTTIGEHLKLSRQRCQQKNGAALKKTEHIFVDVQQYGPLVDRLIFQDRRYANIINLIYFAAGYPAPYVLFSRTIIIAASVMDVISNMLDIKRNALHMFGVIQVDHGLPDTLRNDEYIDLIEDIITLNVRGNLITHDGAKYIVRGSSRDRRQIEKQLCLVPNGIPFDLLHHGYSRYASRDDVIGLPVAKDLFRIIIIFGAARWGWVIDNDIVSSKRPIKQKSVLSGSEMAIIEAFVDANEPMRLADVVAKIGFKVYSRVQISKTVQTSPLFRKVSHGFYTLMPIDRCTS